MHSISIMISLNDKLSDDLVEKMKSGNVVTGLNGGSGGFNWNDDQQTPTSGYMSS